MDKMLVATPWRTIRIVICMMTVLSNIVIEVNSLNGPNVCMVQQKYNITKRVKYRAPMSVRTYEWCFSMPPRCSRWKTELRDLTRLETEERTAEIAVCCRGYKIKDVSCIPICPNGRTGTSCSEECPPNKWGPNCVNECAKCLKGFCSPITGECECLEGWQGESCNIRMTTVGPFALMEEILTTTQSTTQTLSPSTKPIEKLSTTRDVEITKSVQSTIPSTSTLSKTTETIKFAIENSTTYSIYDNLTSTAPSTLKTTSSNIIPTVNKITGYAYNRTEIPFEGTSNDLATHVTSSKPLIYTKSISTLSTTTAPVIIMSTSNTSSRLNSTKESTLTIISQNAEVTMKVNPITNKYKHKEIWIKPTQKIASTELKMKLNHDTNNIRNKTVAKNDSIVETTTPRTIIVSIIPTSASSHTSFKKIALTTASYSPRKKLFTKSSNKTELANNKPTQEITMSTIRPFTIKILSTTSSKSYSPLHERKFAERARIDSIKNVTLVPLNLDQTTRTSTNITNSMPRALGAVLNGSRFPNTVTIQSSTNTLSIITTKPTVYIKDERKYVKIEKSKIRKSNVYVETHTTSSSFTEQVKTSDMSIIKPNNESSIKVNLFTITSDKPTEDETFHVLTEPEHITAVMSDKERNINSVDLISVVSIAGGIMMVVITVAVIIVMLERCRKVRYDDVRKINDIRMQVMIDNNDKPPPYVRSIFHTPLPDPPNTDNCHYQPISTLDRNLKQFMRPVVVQNISPIMLENFRGILECHYDHLPRRTHDICISGRSSAAPSTFNDEELRSHRTLSMAEYTIDSLKCEAKLDVIDNNLNSEPLYAEIPCWRPPSEHAIEVMNLNGEAVTEL